MSELCPDVRDLWLRMIEGDGSSDDIWLWADRDEDWIQRNTPGNHCPDLKEEDWTAAQSALRRRLERTQCASPSILGVHVDPTLEEQRRRKARLRDATPAQRIAVISWLICVSTRKEELDYRHGLSSRLNFSLGHLIGAWHSDTSHLLGSIPAFPEKPGAWEQFEEKRTAWGCRCLHSSRLGNLAPGWFRMVVWLREDGSMDANCLNRDQCEACRSRAEQLYGTLYADYAQNTPAVSMLLAFSLVALEVIYRHFGDKLHLLPFLQGVLSRGLRAASRERVEERLRHLCRNGPRDTEFAPWINTYPEVLRNVLARYSCLINSLSRCPSLHEGSDLRDAYLDSLPVGFADDTPNLTILIGSVAWILASRCHERSSDDSTWHKFWVVLLQEDFMKCQRAVFSRERRVGGSSLGNLLACYDVYSE
ncbi:hypothetical protein BDN67DRAFT_972501 [Paxillus ammoniavirescens]|nr:hypothetical protein BDN67DRAFT_972501 [Paxillus ammoniavirescens]